MKKSVKFGLWFLFFWACGLYLLGFSLSGVNVYGIVDALIPFERLVCFVLSVICFWRACYSGKLFVSSLWSKKKGEDGIGCLCQGLFESATQHSKDGYCTHDYDAYND